MDYDLMIAAACLLAVGSLLVALRAADTANQALELVEDAVDALADEAELIRMRERGLL